LTALGTVAVTLVLGTFAGTSISYAQARAASQRSADGSNPESTLNGIAASAQNESKATFKLTYTSQSSGQSPTQVTLEQRPPKQLFLTSSGEILFDGKKTYYCSTSKPVTCISYGSANESPLGALIGVYSTSTYIEAMKGWESLIAARIGGYHISFSNKTFAGQKSVCVTWSYHGSSAQYCVTDKGILAYVGSSSSSFKLTSYSGSAAASDFKLPKGATMTKLP
jgi:hypothetical protein